MPQHSKPPAAAPTPAPRPAPTPAQPAAPAQPDRRIREGLRTLDSIDLMTTLRSKSCLFQAPPSFLRVRFRAALHLALEHWSTSQQHNPKLKPEEHGPFGSYCTRRPHTLQTRVASSHPSFPARRVADAPCGSQCQHEHIVQPSFPRQHQQTPRDQQISATESGHGIWFT